MDNLRLLEWHSLPGNSTGGVVDFSSAISAREAMKDFVIYRGDFTTVAYNPSSYWPHPHLVVWAVGKKSKGPSVQCYTDLSQDVRDEMWLIISKIWTQYPDFVFSINCNLSPGPGRAQSIELVHIHLLPSPQNMTSEQWFSVRYIDRNDPENRDLIHFFSGLNEMNACLFENFAWIASQIFPFTHLAILEDHGDAILEIPFNQHRCHQSSVTLFEQVYKEAYLFIQSIACNITHPFWDKWRASSLSHKTDAHPKDILGFSIGICENSLRIKFTINDISIHPKNGEESRQRGWWYQLSGWLVDRWPYNKPPSPDEQEHRRRVIANVTQEVQRVLG